ncbi:hypothetical protein JYT79_00100 [Cardiobacterium sp. AH-315-I02]|nr:hypothetical protein [Cardiobacterium sp. AH-315-I02]
MINQEFKITDNAPDKWKELYCLIADSNYASGAWFSIFSKLMDEKNNHHMVKAWLCLDVLQAQALSCDEVKAFDVIDFIVCISTALDYHQRLKYGKKDKRDELIKISKTAEDLQKLIKKNHWLSNVSFFKYLSNESKSVTIERLRMQFLGRDTYQKGITKDYIESIMSNFHVLPSIEEWLEAVATKANQEVKIPPIVNHPNCATANKIYFVRVVAMYLIETLNPVKTNKPLETANINMTAVVLNIARTLFNEHENYFDRDFINNNIRNL